MRELMGGMVVVDVRGRKEARALLDALSGRDLQNRTRRGTRRGAAVGRKALKAEVSRRSDLPHSFSKMATRGHRNPVGTSTGPKSPLINIFEPGAAPHAIGSGGELLRGGVGSHYRTEPFYARGPVGHPGMAARPLIGPVFDREEDAMSDATMDEIFKGLR